MRQEQHTYVVCMVRGDAVCVGDTKCRKSGVGHNCEHESARPPRGGQKCGFWPHLVLYNLVGFCNAGIWALTSPFRGVAEAQFGALRRLPGFSLLHDQNAPHNPKSQITFPTVRALRSLPTPAVSPIMLLSLPAMDDSFHWAEPTYL